MLKFYLNLFNVDYQPDEHGMIFSNVTLFFGIVANKKNVSARFWKDFSKPDKKPQFNVNANTPNFFKI
ncbi:hypothetical protein JTY60_01790 [symbiont of Argiope bruennichi]|uniref:hypothetical protein n=1 Tax=symbiont of Argiope bruennichi TaxID=2810479 RepID=UPI003DA2F1B7